MRQRANSLPQLQQLGHYARDCPLPPVTCMYCHATDHDTEDFPNTIGKNIGKKEPEQSECPVDFCRSQG
jgi:hypothetical protein